MSGGFIPAEPHRRKLTRVPDGAAVVPGHGAPLLAEIDAMRERRAAVRAGQIMDDDTEQDEPARVAATEIARQAGAIAAGQPQRPGPKLFGVSAEYLAARRAEERERERKRR